MSELQSNGKLVTVYSKAVNISQHVYGVMVSVFQVCHKSINQWIKFQSNRIRMADSNRISEICRSLHSAVSHCRELHTQSTTL